MEKLWGEKPASQETCVSAARGTRPPLLLSLPGGAGATLQRGQGVVEAGGDCLGETGGKLVVARHTLGLGHRQRCLDSGFLSHCGDASHFLSVHTCWLKKKCPVCWVSKIKMFPS